MRNQLEKGFTLLEMLVVLVILGMTTSILSQGLVTTGQNFQRLAVRDLSLSVAQLPAQWFRDSVKHALLYHPYKPIVEGGANKFRLVTGAVPNNASRIPFAMEWVVAEEDGLWSLGFTSGQGELVLVKESSQILQFEYLVNDEWISTFAPKDSQLPSAVRVNEGDSAWITVVPGRPVMADVPADLPAYGSYTF